VAARLGSTVIPLKMKITAILEDEFHNEGRGPELQRVVWADEGKTLKGFEYYNPEDTYDEEDIKHLEIIGVEACAMAGDEVHGNIHLIEESKASIFKVEDSPWLQQFNPSHLEGCDHYQLEFYDEIYDVICKEIKPGKGRLCGGGV
jgi:hypothetical protein